MNRFLILLAGFFFLAICACAQVVPPPPLPLRPPVPSPARLVTSGVNCSDGKDLLKHVYYVNLTISSAGGTNTVAPNSDFNPVDPKNMVNDDSILTDLAAAFNANKKFAMNMLCPPSGGYREYSGLDAILINIAGCTNNNMPSTNPNDCSSMSDQDIADNSWALRTPVPQGSTACVTGCKKYVAISLGLWRNTPCPSPQTNCAPTFTQYQTRLNQAMLDRTAVNGMHVRVAPVFSVSSDGPGSNNDDPGLAVLAALAHERGHIYWFEQFVEPPGSAQASNIDQFCGSGAASFYPTGKWQGQYPVGIPDRVLPRFVTFAELDQNSPLDQAPPYNNLPYQLFYNQSQLINSTYTDGLYLSILAAYSPDEDFVESFEWSVLRKSKKKDLGWTANNHPVLEHGNGHFPGVENKMKCFDKVSK
jgi:hypothetical protein